jgi:small-conductance mechanosensitive channel
MAIFCLSCFVAAVLQLAELSAKLVEMQRRMDALKTDNSDLLRQLADVTSRWQTTVAANARLSRDNMECNRIIASLSSLLHYGQQSLPAFQ